MDFREIINRSVKIREQYFEEEETILAARWTVEQDALAFLTDAGLVGRLTMDDQGAWPSDDNPRMLRHKLGECVWWLAVLASRMNLDLEACVSEFLDKKEQLFK